MNVAVDALGKIPSNWAATDCDQAHGEIKDHASFLRRLIFLSDIGLDCCLGL